MCIVFSVIEYVYWCLGVIFFEYVRYWEFVCELSGIPCYLYCFVISICERDEWPSPKDSEPLSFPSLHSLLMWLHFMFDLSRSPLFFTYHCFAIIFIVACDSSHSLYILFSPYSNSSRVRYSLRIIITHHYRFILLYLSPYRHHIHVRHPQVHGSWDSLYMLHFIYEGMFFLSSGIWV